MKFDDVLTILGGFGRYQLYAFFFLNVVNFLGAFTTLQHVFYTGQSDHWCKTFDPPKNCSAFGFNTSQECMAAIKAVSIPPAENYPKKDKYYYDNCKQWDLPEDLQFSPDINYTDYNATKVACKNGWIFDNSQYTTTLIEDWNLICEDKGVSNTMSSVFFGGFMFGSLVFGIISDWFGRKKAVMGAMVLWFLGVLATPFPSETWQYYIVRFVTGTGQLGRWLPAYVLVNEFVAAKWRVVAGVLIGITYSFGFMTVALVAMAIRKWRVLAFVPIIPVFLSIFLVLPLTESVRWLLSKGRTSEADEVIRKVGKWNKKKLPDVIFDENEIKGFKDAAKGRPPSFIDLYRYPSMCMRTLILQFNWMTNSMVYYGLAFSTSDLGADDYWTFFISGAVEVPALIYATIGARYIGRKVNMIALELIGGIACLTTIFIADVTLKTAVAMVGKFCITATFNIVYLWTSELYPTPVRTVTIGLCSVTARVGSIVAPQILNIAGDLKIPNLHLIVFGVASILAGMLLLPLPRTKDMKLPETMREGEEFGKLNCMKSWSWQGPKDTEDTEDLDTSMNVYRKDVQNPAYVADDEGYAYDARPPPYKTINEKGCQFPEKPRQKTPKKKKDVSPLEGIDNSAFDALEKKLPKEMLEKAEAEVQCLGGETTKDGGIETPKDVGEAPKDDGEAPKDDGEAPKDGGEAPKDGGEAPKDSGEAPKDGGEAPKDGGETPKNGGETPKYGEESPGESGGEESGGSASPDEDKTSKDGDVAEDTASHSEDATKDDSTSSDNKSRGSSVGGASDKEEEQSSDSEASDTSYSFGVPDDNGVDL